MDRIEYEEWALKAVKEGEGVKVSKDGQVLERIEVSVASILSLGLKDSG